MHNLSKALNLNYCAKGIRNPVKLCAFFTISAMHSKYSRQFLSLNLFTKKCVGSIWRQIIVRGFAQVFANLMDQLSILLTKQHWSNFNHQQQKTIRFRFIPTILFSDQESIGLIILNQLYHCFCNLKESLLVTMYPRRLVRIRFIFLDYH